MYMHVIVGIPRIKAQLINSYPFNVLHVELLSIDSWLQHKRKIRLSDKATNIVLIPTIYRQVPGTCMRLLLHQIQLFSPIWSMMQT